MRWVICTVCLLAGILPLRSAEPLIDPVLATTKLSDGRTVTLNAVARVGQRIHIGDWKRSTSIGRDSIALWITFPLKPDYQRDRLWERVSDLTIISEAGERFRAGRNSIGPHGQVSTAMYALDSFPRHDKSFRITGTMEKLPFSFRIKNPDFGKEYPKMEPWIAGSIPATNRVDGVDFVLRKTHMSISPLGIAGMPMTLDAFMDGKDISRRYIKLGRLYDPWGNRFNLSTNEPVWKVQFSITKRYNAPWFTDEYFDLPLKRFPGHGEYETLEMQRTLKGQKFGRAWIGGPGAFKMENGFIIDAKPFEKGMHGSTYGGQDIKGFRTAQWSYSHPWLMLTNVTGGKRGQLRIVSLIDADGIKIDIRSGGGGGSGKMYLMPHRVVKTYEFDQQAKKLGKEPPYTLADSTRPPYTVRIAITEKRYTDFYIDPSKLRRVVYPEGSIRHVPKSPEEPYPVFSDLETGKSRRVYPIE